MLALCCVPSGAWADNAVVTVDGQPVAHTLSSISFSGDNVVLHFADGTTDQTVAMTSVVISMTVSNGLSAIESQTTLSLQPESIEIGGVAAGERVALYDTTGRLRMQTTASGNTTSLYTANLAAGVYIVKAGKQTLKFQKQ